MPFTRLTPANLLTDQVQFWADYNPPYTGNDQAFGINRWRALGARRSLSVFSVIIRRCVEFVVLLFISRESWKRRCLLWMGNVARYICSGLGECKGL